MTTQAPYLHCPSYQLSRWPRQDSPSGSKDGHSVAVCLGSSLLFGSCIHNSPCRYKSHCRRPAFACSPFHRSPSTEKRGVKRVCCGDFLWQPQKASILHTTFGLLWKLQSALSYLAAQPFISGHSRLRRTLPKLGLRWAGISNPSFSGAPRERKDAHLPTNSLFLDL